jgi:glycosyltransferase involved in cell wall biosynthesis/SAM-dependent methyltransferase
LPNLPLISVIMPVYNAEKHLQVCLDSVVNQTLKDIEIICVNDGSTDNSLNILEKYQQKDDRIKIITQENQGAGVARNQGLKVAKGKYLSILDSDDFFDLNMLELMYEKALETDADITICRADGYDNSTGTFFDMSWSLKERFLPNKEVFNYTDIKEHIFDFAVGWSWDKMYNSSFVFENNLQFQDLRSTNDMLFVFLSLVKAQKITTVDKILAHQRRNVTTSLSQTREKDPLCFYDAIKALKEELIKANLFSEVEHSFINWSLHFCFWHLGNNEKSDYILSELKNRIFKELEFYKYPKNYFYDKNLYNKFMEVSAGDNSIINKRFGKISSFAYISKKEKLNPKNIYKILKAKGLIESFNLFDEKYYLIRNMHIRSSNMNPLDHYIYHGWKEGRTPSSKFDGEYYLDRYPDVKASKMNPLVHYVLYGKKEGKYPNPDTDSSFSENKKVGKQPLLLKPSDKPRISIIIPTFNVEMYLEECLDSVINQTLRDIEIICVNDGSTDNSLPILEEYAEKDERIKIISKPNSGYGHTMNVGIEAATGEYIGIVEPDDYVKLDMYETLYIEAVKNDVEVIKADFYRFTGSGENFEKTYVKVAREDENYNRIINPRNELEIFRFAMNTWSGIYKREFIEKHNIRHNETPGASFQDNGFWFQTLALATRTYFLSKPFYMNRRDNQGSSVHDKGKVFAMCKEYDFIRKFLDRNPVLDRNIEFKEKLICVYQLKRYHNYIFTLNRIGPEFHKMFLEKFHEDYVLAAENNELDEEIFSNREWNILQLIIKDPTCVKESDYKIVSRKSSADKYSANGLIHKRKFNRLLSFPYILKKEKFNPKNIYRIFKARGQIESLNLFDEKYYLTKYSYLTNSNIELLNHYLYHGWKEEKNPSRKFDGNYYLKRYPDVKKSKTNPLVHYVLRGKAEGRFPNYHAEIKLPQNINKKLQGRIQNLEKSLSQSNNNHQNMEKEIEENNQSHRKEIENFEKKLNLINSILHDIIKGYNKKKICPACETEVIAFLPVGNTSNVQCPNCGSYPRHRATYIFLKENTSVFKENIKLLHIAPEKIFYDIFRNQKNINYLTADLNDEKPHVMEKMDIQAIQYPDNTFDFIYCSHVLEHVPDDRKAINELYRVLKPDGKAIISVPLFRFLDKTFEDPSYNTPELRLKHYGQSDHLRMYGPDFTDRLEDAGFRILSDDIKFSEDMDEEDLKKYGIDKGIQFFYCVKPG